MAVLSGTVARAAPGISVAALAALPQVSDIELSPDAQLVAWCDHSGPDAKVVIFDLAAKAFRRTLSGLNKRVTLIKLRGDDDSLSQSDTRLTVLQDTERFLHEYLN